jgi:hypothetical protein
VIEDRLNVLTPPDGVVVPVVREAVDQPARRRELEFGDRILSLVRRIADVDEVGIAAVVRRPQPVSTLIPVDGADRDRTAAGRHGILLGFQCRRHGRALTLAGVGVYT